MFWNLKHHKDFQLNDIPCLTYKWNCYLIDTWRQNCECKRVKWKRRLWRMENESIGCPNQFLGNKLLYDVLQIRNRCYLPSLPNDTQFVTQIISIRHMIYLPPPCLPFTHISRTQQPYPTYRPLVTSSRTWVKEVVQIWSP